VASEAGGEGAGRFETLTAFWRVGRLAWRVARGKRPKAKQLRKAAASASEVGGKALAQKAPKLPLRRLAELLRHVRGEEFSGHIRRMPVQRSLDVAVPTEVAFAEWMRLESLPEGAHRVEQIQRRGRRLVGEINGFGQARDWEAEIRDKRPNESFAWRSTHGSDVAGLITFHSLSERLTRLELELDVVPTHPGEAASLALHLADRKAEADLRRFKHRVETISPDAYPSHTTKTANRSNRKSTKKKEA
jgi:uncharacterized membrane protein